MIGVKFMYDSQQRHDYVYSDYPAKGLIPGGSI
jgi:hypothetical protein